MRATASIVYSVYSDIQRVLRPKLDTKEEYMVNKNNNRRT